MDERLSELLDQILGASQFLNINQNPVVVSTSAAVKPDVAQALIQYSFLPEVIAELLCCGVVKMRAWSPVKDELLRNLGEELGSRSDGATHFTILKNCLRKEAGLDLDAGHTPAEATAVMIRNVRTWITDRTLHEAAGALYALEASATPELKVVGHIINLYATAALGKLLVSEKYDDDHASGIGPWTLDRFLAIHVVDFEKGHRDLLADALAEFVVQDRDRDLFCQGFRAVIEEMETWWTALGKRNAQNP